MTYSYMPHIPDEEFIERWRRVQALMTEKAIDILFAYGDDRAVFGPAHVRWLADIPVHFEPLCVMLLPEGEPVLLSGPESDVFARLRGRVRDVRVLREFTHPDEDYPFSVIQSLIEILSDLGWKRGSLQRAGIGGLGLMNQAAAGSLKNALPGVEWVDLEKELCGLRAIKTTAEIKVILKAYQIAELGIQSAVAAIQPGVTEREIAAAADCAMRYAGAEGFGIDTIVASGPNTSPILARSTFRIIEARDQVLLTVAPRYEGYHGAIGRLVFVGKPDEQIKRAYETAVRAQKECQAQLQAGVKGRLVEAAGRQVTAAGGYGDYFLYSGLHSVGVIEFEPPIFGPCSEDTIEENMVISVDIPMFNAPWGGLRVEDGYLIGVEGAQNLNQTDYYFYR